MARTLALLVLAAALAGCGGDGDGSGAGDTAPTATTGGEAAAACTSEQGYSLSYPEGWHEERCAYFDPEPFEVPEATEFLDVAVLASREPVSLEVAAGDDRTRTILSREETQVAGRDALRLEAETTGEGLLDRGVRYYQVLVSVDGDTIFVSTYGLPGLDYERNKRAVDEIAASLEPTG